MPQLPGSTPGLADGTLTRDDKVTHLMGPADFYPETKPVDDLFVEMRTKGTQLVLLVDEFGSIAGLLTLKQVVSEIVGSITEEGIEPDVETIDERYSTVEAERRLREAGGRPTRDRAKVDAAAAAVVLQAHLDARRASSG